MKRTSWPGYGAHDWSHGGGGASSRPDPAAAGDPATAVKLAGTPLLPTPPQLFRLLEQGEITHKQLQQALAHHAHMLFREINETRRNPVLAYFEQRLNRRVCERLVARHGEARLRAILVALSEVPKFPPARFLWHAASVNVPLHSIIRTRQEPVFRLIDIEDSPPDRQLVKLEHGPARKRQAIREHFVLQRQADGSRQVLSRQWVN